MSDVTPIYAVRPPSSPRKPPRLRRKHFARAIDAIADAECVITTATRVLVGSPDEKDAAKALSCLQVGVEQLNAAMDQLDQAALGR